MSNKNRIIIFILSAVCLCLLLILLTILVLMPNNSYDSVEYIPPEFDKYAKIGMPNPEFIDNYVRYQDKRLPYTVYLCDVMYINEDDEANIFFTNDSRNNAWLKLRITNENGDVVAETGLIRPNEYIECIKVIESWPEMDYAEVTVMAYEPNTYYSIGNMRLKVRIERCI